MALGALGNGPEKVEYKEPLEYGVLKNGRFALAALLLTIING